MNRDTQRLLRILAVVIFALGALLVAIEEGDARLLQALLFGGLAVFALSFVPA
jgi:uncharacterized membrane protein YqjE